MESNFDQRIEAVKAGVVDRIGACDELDGVARIGGCERIERFYRTLRTIGKAAFF